jgi:hypothetical protein
MATDSGGVRKLRNGCSDSPEYAFCWSYTVGRFITRLHGENNHNLLGIESNLNGVNRKLR